MLHAWDPDASDMEEVAAATQVRAQKLPRHPCFASALERLSLHDVHHPSCDISEEAKCRMFVNNWC